MALQKHQMVARLDALLSERIAASAEAIASTHAALVSDTKSSAGDKHEVGRAMVQQELDKLQAQQAQLVHLRHELHGVPLDRVHDRVAFGSMVVTDGGTYFVAIGLGRLEVEGRTCYAVSLASPIGQVLKDQQAGAEVHFNGRKWVVLDVY